MANAWKQPDLIAGETLRILEDALVLAPLTARDFTAEFNKTPNGFAVGDSVDVKLRPDYEAKEFTSTIEIQSIRESKRPITIEKHYDISVNVTAKEKKLDLDSFSEQVIQPAAYRLAEKVDEYLGTKILRGRGMYVSNSLFGSRADMALARKAATLQQLSPASRRCLVDLDLEAQLLGADWFSSADIRGDATGAAIQNAGYLNRTLGMDFFSSINFSSTTRSCGNGTSTTDNGAGGNTNNQIGTKTLTIDALTGSITAGDRIQIAGVRRPVIAAANASATATTITLVDEIDEIIPDGAAISVIGSGQSITFKGAIFDGNSIALAMPMLDPADDKPSFVVSSNGFSIRVVMGYDMSAKTSTLSMDLLVGAEAHDPRRITLLADY